MKGPRYASTWNLRVACSRVWPPLPALPGTSNTSVRLVQSAHVCRPRCRDVSCFVGSFGGGVFAYKVGPAGNMSLVARTPADQEGKVDA